MTDKYAHVRRGMRKPAGAHHCHWPGCNAKVPPALWGCRRHWYMLPATLRARIWLHYKPGQEVSKTPSAEYIAVANDVQAWIKRQRPRIEE